MHKQVVWITGASSGIGKALAEQYAAQGASVVLAARRVDVLNALVAQLPSPERHMAVYLDLLQRDSFDTALHQVLTRYGRIDVLINNAGISQRALISETTMETERRLMEVDYFAQVELTKLLLPQFEKQASGQIAFVSSIAGLLGTQYRASYSAAKAALHMWANSLRAEVAEKGIQVAVIFPGFVQTDVSINALNGKGEAQGYDNEATANGLTAQDFAQQTLTALNKGKEYIVVGGPKEKLGVVVSRLAPPLLYKMIRKMKVK